jgi:hypothetical protein
MSTFGITPFYYFCPTIFFILNNTLMALKEKYASALAVCEKLGMHNSRIEEGADGILRIWGNVSFGYDKDQIWDAIKAAGGASPADVVADLQVDNPNIYARHTVAKGESLSKIAKHYYDDMMKYKQIFDANRDQLDDPDKIEVGQVLVVPNP